jgi:hypothetical protein
MTETEWLACDAPELMLEFLRTRATHRKLRLFAAAAFGRLIHVLPNPEQRRGVVALEQLAEGSLHSAECRQIIARVRRAIPRDDWSADEYQTDHLHFIGLMLYREFRCASVGHHAVQAVAGLADGVPERHGQVKLMRCIAGNPFRPATVSPSWLTSTALALADTIYADRAFDRLPILADALEDAGCADPDILAHCRGPGPHVRGCWVVDLVLGKS